MGRTVQNQTGQGNPPKGFKEGTEYSREQINAALQAENKEEGQKIVFVRDVSGHGTQVIGIAAGNGRASNVRYRGVA